MAVIWIPALLRDLTGGAERMVLPAESVDQAVERLEEHFPGIRGRLCDGDSLRPSIMVVVDGEVSRKRMRQALGETSEVHFLPATGGG